jgi:hypothetical protein
MDFSNYSIEHQYYDSSNEMKLGFFKDEAKGKLITELIGLQPKYMFLIR